MVEEMGRKEMGHREMGRIVIDDIRPSTPRRHPAKASVGEAVRVSADIYKDGHDVLAARVQWSGPDGKQAAASLHELGNDRWEGVIEPTTLGLHELVVEAWTDAYAARMKPRKAPAKKTTARTASSGARWCAPCGTRP